MRLIRIINIVLLFIAFSQFGNAQYETKRANLSETFLEERHLRYMYNFALNGLFFQYKSNLDYFKDETFNRNPVEIEKLLILTNNFRFEIKNLIVFIYPETLKDVKYVLDNSHSIKSLGLSSQFEIEFISTQNRSRKEKIQIISQKIAEKPNVDYVVDFSNLVIMENKIYLSVRSYTPAFFNPNLTDINPQIYEFEWCESTGWVYPRRVTSRFFFMTGTDFKRMGGTIDIPSLKCY